MDLFVLVEKLSADGVVLVPASEFVDHYPMLTPPPGSPGRLRVSVRGLGAERSTPFLPVPELHDNRMLAPGEVVAVDIALMPVAMRWHAGEQLRLTFAGHHVGRPVPTPITGTHLLHTGPNHPAVLHLSVVRLSA